MTNKLANGENSSKRLKSATRYNQKAEADCDKQIIQKDEKVHQRLKWPPVTIKRQIVTDKLALESHLYKVQIVQP